MLHGTNVKILEGCFGLPINLVFTGYCIIFQKQFSVYDIAQFKAVHIAVKLVSNIHFHAM
jgi:hypothetical protein